MRSKVGQTLSSVNPSIAAIVLQLLGEGFPVAPNLVIARPWKPIRIGTISPGRRVMDRLFVDRVVGSVCRIKPPPARRAPGGVVFGDAPLEYDLDLFPRRNLRCDLRRNGDLAVWLEFASEVNRLHYSFLTCLIISRVRTPRRARAPSWLPCPVSE